MLIISIFSLMFVVALSNHNSLLLTNYLRKYAAVTLIFIFALNVNIISIDNINSGISIYSNLFVVNNVNLSIDILLCLLTLAILIFPSYLSFNIQFISLNIIEFILVILFSLLGISLLIIANDLMTFYLAIELQSFALYIIATLNKESEYSCKAGLIYFLLGAISSALILLGMSLLYIKTGITNLSDLIIIISFDIDNISLFAISIILIGLLFKISAAPFHNWAVFVYDGVSTLVTIWLIIIPKLSILIMIMKLLNINGDYHIKYLLIISCLLSLIIGSIIGLSQVKLKKLLTYSTINHVGFILIALMINSEQSIESLVIYISQYAITNLNIFIIIIAYSNQINNSMNYIKDLVGIFKKNPILTVSITISLISLAGIPPFIGFFAKANVLMTAIHNGETILYLVGILISIISAYYYLNLVGKMYFENENNVYSYKKELNSMHSYLISLLTLTTSLYMLKSQLVLNSLNLLTLSHYFI